MKLKTNFTDIERHHVDSETVFTIKTNALSFQILSSGLYTDPKMAIIRELACNAYDAHIAANNSEVPFQIHLPNELEPYLSIKDFGTGLSDTDIQGELTEITKIDETGQVVPVLDAFGKPTYRKTGGLYTTYFDSSKTESNDYIGALGLGSKSPFSYCEAFEVISRYNGIKTTYAIFLNEERIPTVTKLNTILTDEHNGIEIKIPVANEDFVSFRTKASQILKYFPVLPKVVGAIHFKFDELPSPSIKTKDWIIYNMYNNYNKRIIVVQGYVPYKVELNNVPEEYRHCIPFIKEYGIILYFNIGEIEIAANREEIRYTEDTLITIFKAIEKTIDEYTTEVNKQIVISSTTYWDACMELKPYSRLLNQSIKLDKLENKLIKRFITDNGLVKIDNYHGYDVLRYRLSIKLIKNSYSYSIDKFIPEKTRIVAINDVKGGLTRLAKYMQISGYNEAIVIKKINIDDTYIDKNGVTVQYIGHKKEYDIILENLGHPTVIKTSTLPTPTVNRSPRNTFKIYVYSRQIQHSHSTQVVWDQYDDNDIDIKNGGLYFPLLYGSTFANIKNGKFIPLSFTPSKFIPILQMLVKFYNIKNNTNYDINTNVYGVPGIAYHKIKKHKNWINLFDFMPEFLLQNKEIITFDQRTQNTEDNLSIIYCMSIVKFRQLVNSLDDTSVFKNALKDLLEFNIPEHNKIKNIFQTIYKEFYDEFPTTNTAYFDQNKIFTTYPILSVFNSLKYNRDDWNIIFDYIKLIDNLGEK